ncbi:MAG: helix-turn-helix transcriptional regulator [Dermatophilaceae bacterium]
MTHRQAAPTHPPLAIPVEDGAAVEAIGRISESGMWGRTDPMRARDGEEYIDAGWKAFTTDPDRRDLAWVVRYHPAYGRSVWLVHDEDASSLYSLLEDDVVLWRSGGYWLGHHGGCWHRPSQIFDWTTQRYVSRAVPGAGTITAAGQLGEPRAGRALSVQHIDLNDLGPLARGEWERQLGIWAGSRPADGLAIDRCIVDLTAPELSASQLLNIPEAAAVAGLNVGTLRGYISRGENEVPAPQAVVGASMVWSRPVIDQWVESRNYTTDAAEDAVTVRAFGEYRLPSGVADVWEKVHYWILSDLTRKPELRRGLVRRWRDRRTAQAVAQSLSWTVAAGLGRLIPMRDLAAVIRDAILGDLAIETQRLSDREEAHGGEVYWGQLMRPTARMLGWLIRHSPSDAQTAIVEVISEAGDHPDRYPATTRDSLLLMIKSSLSETSGNPGGTALTTQQIDAFLATVNPDNNPIPAT